MTAPAAPRVMLEDPAAPHQIVPFLIASQMAVSCNCLHRPRQKGWTPIEVRQLFPAADMDAAWRAWHQERGVIV
jgi:hypothetical protein